LSVVIRTGGPSSDETAVLDLPGVREECRAENCKTKHPHKRFCVNGHDTFEVGRISNWTCRECDRERTRERRRERYATDPDYRERKRERARERMHERWISDPEHREQRRERQRERYATDPMFRALRLNAKSRRYVLRAIKRDEALARQLIAKETA